MNRGFVFRMSVLALFAIACLAVGVHFFLQSGGHVRGVNVGSYRLEMSSEDVDGLVNDSEVRIAGVTAGRVTELDAERGEGGAAKIVMTINEKVAPLHEGMTARIAMKSLVGATFIDIVDGKGPVLPDGYRIPATSVLPSVELQDVVTGLEPKTRAALSGTVQSLGAATQGRSGDIGSLAESLGRLGREGTTALDALAAQSTDIEALTRETTTLLDTLDTGNGQIVDVVDRAQKIVHSTAGQRESLESTVRQLPGVLNSARTATGDLRELAGPLGPVAADLRKAAPDLNGALLELPATSKDLRGLLPDLDAVLKRAPATLDRAPELGENVQALVPPTYEILRDAIPALQYVKPYGRDLGAMLNSFASSMDVEAENGVNPVRLAPTVNAQSFRGSPLPFPDALGIFRNPIAQSGLAGHQQPFSGQFPRLERLPN